MVNAKALGALIFILACVSCLPKAGVPQANLHDIEDQARLRWQTATCFAGVHPEIMVVKAPLVCGTIKNAYGCFTGIMNLVELSEKIPYKYLLSTVTHEFGHALAVDQGHVTPFSGIMAARASDGLPYITQADLDLICHFQECPCQHPESPSTPLFYSPP